MALRNKLNISDPAKLAQEEERITKRKALELYDKGLLDTFEVGTFRGLADIHRYLFEEVYDFAGEMRTENIAKGNFRFASVLYLEQALAQIGKMPQGKLEEIIEKYVEMNVAHPFREGNGRSTRIWLDRMLKKEVGLVVDWSSIEKGDYLRAMERSPVWDLEIKTLLKGALTDKTQDRAVYMKGIDASYSYEGYETYRAADFSAETADGPAGRESRTM